MQNSPIKAYISQKPSKWKPHQRKPHNVGSRCKQCCLKTFLKVLFKLTTYFKGLKLLDNNSTQKKAKQIQHVRKFANISHAAIQLPLKFCKVKVCLCYTCTLVCALDIIYDWKGHSIRVSLPRYYLDYPKIFTSWNFLFICQRFLIGDREVYWIFRMANLKLQF